MIPATLLYSTLPTSNHNINEFTIVLLPHFCNNLFTYRIRDYYTRQTNSHGRKRTRIRGVGSAVYFPFIPLQTQSPRVANIFGGIVAISHPPHPTSQAWAKLPTPRPAGQGKPKRASVPQGMPPSTPPAILASLQIRKLSFQNIR